MKAGDSYLPGEDREASEHSSSPLGQEEFREAKRPRLWSKE